MLSLRQSIRFFKPARRTLCSSRYLLQQKPVVKTAQNLAEVNGPETLIGPGAKEGTVPTDLDQETGLARLELLGKLEGIDVFDTKPLDSSRKGTMKDPIIIESYDDYRYVGCTGSPAGSHTIMWLKPTVNEVARCWECGSVYKLNPVGVPNDDHHH
ncbi:cytochrome c oxidase subunit IV [Saccharomyces cerevisiae]|nr:cytochrome c oxidase subunit IV [Saccharomyces cerevisiae]